MSNQESQSTSQKNESEEEIVRKLYKFIESHPGSEYFINNDPSTYSQTGYVKSRGLFAADHNNACMKEFVDIFRNSQSEVHRDFANSTKRITKKIVRQYSSESIGSIGTIDANANSEANSVSSIEVSSSISSSPTLCSTSIKMMKDEFNDNYESYDGSSWVLPSGSDFDAVVRDHVLAQPNSAPPIPSFGTPRMICVHYFHMKKITRLSSSV
ncbi:hypothetical protein BGZ76_005546 [Entomortierella beljakovae]|nr:hypothetical protein BGZ76_005546 [Entomortierella beljakovae]